MESNDVFRILEDIASSNYIEKPMLVGGFTRDLYLGFSANTKDIDITTNSPNITRLAVSFSEKVGENFIFFEDGHITINFKENNYDFSSNFMSEKVIKYLNFEMNILDEKLYEIYSRDFTINTLHKFLFSEDIIDPTTKGIDDCNNKIIKTVCPPEITLSDDARRGYRAIELAARFDFEIDSNILSFIKNNLELFSIEKNLLVKENYVISTIAKSLENNADKTIGYLLETNLFYKIPLVGKFKEELIKKRLILNYLDNSKKY